MNPYLPRIMMRTSRPKEGPWFEEGGLTWEPGQTLGRHGSNKQGGTQKAYLYPRLPSDEVIENQPDAKSGSHPGFGWVPLSGEKAEQKADKYKRMSTLYHTTTVDGKTREYMKVPMVHASKRTKIPLQTAASITELNGKVKILAPCPFSEARMEQLLLLHSMPASQGCLLLIISTLCSP